MVKIWQFSGKFDQQLSLYCGSVKPKFQTGPGYWSLWESCELRFPKFTDNFGTASSNLRIFFTFAITSRAHLPKCWSILISDFPSAFSLSFLIKASVLLLNGSMKSFRVLEKKGGARLSFTPKKIWDFAFFEFERTKHQPRRNLPSYLILKRLCNEAALSPGIDAFWY